MEFHTWEPVYERILADFGYGRAGDEQARDVLADIVDRESVRDLETLSFEGNTVAIAGGGPNLSDELETVEDADSVVAASVAAERLADHGYRADLVVTDLDKTPAFAQELTSNGTPVAVHAHGDNIPAVREYVPGFGTEWLIPTTQAAPAGPVENVGGFTDGDRAAFLADELGAGRLSFPGWRFDDPSVSAEKAKKLVWAERLLLWLERRRDECFAVLDGRRADIDDSTLPDTA
jgi:uncharacterized Rossmann fold enzyme